MKIAIITGAPTPYRDPVFAQLPKFKGDHLTLVYCSHREPARSWDLEMPDCDYVVLKENFKTKAEDKTFIVHNNPDVWKELKRIKPDVVITQGFNPTYLYSWIYTVLHRKKHIMLFDDWLFPESTLSKMHRVVRKIVFKFSHAFAGPGKHTADLYRSYGIKDESIFVSHLCADKKRFTVSKPLEDRQYDVMFAGQFRERKDPHFFVDVVLKMKETKPDIKALLIGNGPLKEEVLKRLDDAGVDYNYPGFIQPTELPKYYADAKLFLFTTRLDAWGVVANEALASGTPVIGTPYAGSCDDIVVDGENGYILELDSDEWAKKSLELINDKDTWTAFSEKGKTSIDEYNYENAAKGLYEACVHAYQS